MKTRHVLIPFLSAGMLLSAADQERFSITLLVDSKKEAALYHDEPLLLNVGLSHAQATDDLRWNEAGRRNVDQSRQQLAEGKIKRQEFEAESLRVATSMRMIPFVSMGSSSDPWFMQVKFDVSGPTETGGAMLSIKHLKIPESDSMAVLNGSNYYSASYGIDPDTLRKIAPGKYTIRAAAGGVESNTITVEILKNNAPVSYLRKIETLLKYGRYYLYADRAEKSLEYAQRILRQDKNSVDGLVLRGDAYIQKGMYREALRDFELALSALDKQHLHEAPEYILGSISFLKAKLGMKE